MFFFGTSSAIIPYLGYLVVFWIILIGNCYLSSTFKSQVSNDLAFKNIQHGLLPIQTETIDTYDYENNVHDNVQKYYTSGLFIENAEFHSFNKEYLILYSYESYLQLFLHDTSNRAPPI